MPARIVILLALVLTINVPAMADAVDLGALLNETEGAVTRLDNGIEKARMLVALARGYAKHGDRLRALHWLNRAVNLALSIPPDWISIDALLNRDQLLRKRSKNRPRSGTSRALPQCQGVERERPTKNRHLRGILGCSQVSGQGWRCRGSVGDVRFDSSSMGSTDGTCECCGHPRGVAPLRCRAGQHRSTRQDPSRGQGCGRSESVVSQSIALNDRARAGPMWSIPGSSADGGATAP